jgi:hypothetical protein
MPAIQNVKSDSCFIFGLCPDISMQVKFRSPKTITEALYVADTVYLTVM